MGPLRVFIRSTFALVILSLSPEYVSAHENGMDMSMDGPMNLAAGNMISYLHFTPGDVLWLQGWVPRSSGVMVGTCIGLVLLGMVERWLAACRTGMERHWRDRARIAYANKLTTLPTKDKKNNAADPALTSTIFMRRIPPFIPAFDLMRGVMHAAQSAIGFLLMLVVMTFQVAFLLSIVVGLGIGETLFGRYISAGGLSLEAH